MKIMGTPFGLRNDKIKKPEMPILIIDGDNGGVLASELTAIIVSFLN